MSDVTSFLLIRHGETDWNAAGRWQGHGDPALSERGRAQASAVARALADHTIDRLLCSDLQRALETAEAIGKQLDLSPLPDARLRELDVGSWTGLTRAEITQRDADLLRRFDLGEPDVRPGGGESRRQIRARVRDAVIEWGRAHKGERIAVVAHFGVIRALVPGSEPEHVEVVATHLEEIEVTRASDR